LKNPETSLPNDLDFVTFAYFFFGVAACGGGVTAVVVAEDAGAGGLLDVV
jgi:hypothetical protein